MIVILIVVQRLDARAGAKVNQIIRIERIHRLRTAPVP